MSYKTPTPRDEGIRAGRAGLSYLPWLRYRSSGDWIEFYDGWLEGKRLRLTEDVEIDRHQDHARRCQAIHYLIRRHQCASC